MNLTHKELGKLLKQKLDKGITIPCLAQWAYALFQESRGSLPSDLNDLLQSLFLMELGIEFEYSLSELHKLADDLMNKDHE